MARVLRAMLRMLALLAVLGVVAPRVLAQSADVEKLLLLLVKKQVITAEEAEAFKTELAEERAVQQAPAAAQRHAKPPEPPPEPNSTAERRLRVNGWAQAWYSDAAGSKGSFALRRARLDLRGELSDKIAYRLQADFVRNPVLLDAYVDVNYLPWARLRIGQFKVPFSFENLMSSRDLLTVERSLPVLSLAPGRDTGNIGRDIGFRAEGSIVRGDGQPLLDYTVGMFNGAGINRQDDNHRKDGALRVVVHAAPGLQLAGSYYNGETGTAQVDRERAAAEFSFKRGNWTLFGEYLWARDGGVHARGSYTMAAYRFRPKWEAVFRFEEIDPRRLVKHDDTRGYLMGLNWYVNRCVKWQNNYVIFDGAGKRRANHTLLSQLQFEF